MSSRVACLFPAFAMRYREFRRDHLEGCLDVVLPLVERAEEVVTIDREKFESPDAVVLSDELDDALQGQYACYIDNCAAAEILRDRYANCHCVAGYSMGLFSALYFCGVTSFEEGLLLTRDICRLAHDAAPAGEYGMGAVMGLTVDEVRQVMSAAKSHTEVSDICGKRAVILSGARSEIEDVLDGCIAFGAMNAKLLPVSLPFHSTLLRSAEPHIRELLRTFKLRPPRVPIVSAITQEVLVNGDDVREELARNVSHPMNWFATMQKLLELGVNQMYECGLSESLTNLATRNVRGRYTIQHVKQPNTAVPS
jgi:malonate decarboxylase epsilon subunit